MLEVLLATSFAFLKANMPPQDVGRVSDEYLRENVELAEEARATAPWRDQLTDEIFREYVLPYSSIGEDADAWRPVFRAKFYPLVQDAKTPTEAAEILHAIVWKTLGVRYDTRRDKADQSPFHSMRIGMASCTGLAILEIDAFRACGIPARLTGCNWTTIPGNHSWVEFYDNGAWHFFGDPEGIKPAPIDRSWFTDYAAYADASQARTRIYATRWSANAEGTKFWTTWNASDRPSEINADDVTDSYVRFRSNVAAAKLAFVARGEDHRRVPTEFRLVEAGSGKMLAEATTYDESHDMNDHVIVSYLAGAKAVLQIKDETGAWRSVDLVEFSSKQKLYEIGK